MKNYVEPMNLHPVVVARNIGQTTRAAEHCPLPFRPIRLRDNLLLDSYRHHERPRIKWFWTGVLVGLSVAAGAAIAIQSTLPA